MNQQERDAIMRQRKIEQMVEDYVPVYDPSHYPKPEERLAMAAEYIAHHIGRISRSLDRIAADFPAKK
jgi:hypothetical protein